MEMKKQTQTNDINKDKEEAIFYDIEELIGKNKLNEALHLIENMPEDSFRYGKALFYKSMILGILGNEEKSLETFKKSLAVELDAEMDDLNEKYKPLDFNDPENLFNCGLTNYYFGDYEKAIENFDKSLELLPNQSEAIRYKALSYAALKDYKKAIAIINLAIDLQPKNCHYWNDKGAFLSELNQMTNAHKCFNKSIKLKPNSMNWANKGVLYHKYNNLEKALECYDNAIKLDSQDIYPIIGKAKVYMDLNDFENAEKYFEIAGRIDDTDLEYLVERGKYMMFTENYKQAIRYFDRCLKFNCNLAFVWMFKSMALKKLNCDYEADCCVNRALEFDKDILKKFNEFF